MTERNTNNHQETKTEGNNNLDFRTAENNEQMDENNEADLKGEIELTIIKKTLTKTALKMIFRRNKGFLPL